MHKKNNVTLKTVAETAGCSIAVVSTVLHGPRGHTTFSASLGQGTLDVAYSV